MTIANRFESKHQPEPNTGCWLWTGCIDQAGYGRMWVGRSERAHRVSFTLFKGAIPDGKQIDHLCRNRACVNPDHLEAVTPTTNKLRGVGPTAKRHRQTHCIHGHAFSKENTVRDGRGRRQCRKCQLRRNRERAKRHRRRVRG